jgi:3-oxo-5-alpha-steroid 4-dehydrogenase 1
MIDALLLHRLAIAWIALAFVTFGVLLKVTAPYGRHGRAGWGPTIDSRWGWLLMEAPSALLFAGLFLAAPRHATAADVAFLLMWEAHYVHRAFVYPFRRGAVTRPMPIALAGMAVVFNLVNAGLNGGWVFGLSGGYADAWLHQPRFVIGAALFALGYGINWHADGVLRRLRGTGSGYRIPEGGLYRWVSCPNYLGEIIEWCGWAVATWSLAGLSFAVWTAANLAPRARANHAWYRSRFAKYPAQRKALLPGIW